MSAEDGGPEIGSLMPSWAKVMTLWDAGRSYEQICTETGFSKSFVRSIVCNLDERDDGVATADIRDGSMLLAARLLQCFPHLPDRRRAA